MYYWGGAPGQGPTGPAGRGQDLSLSPANRACAGIKDNDPLVQYQGGRGSR